MTRFPHRAVLSAILALGLSGTAAAALAQDMSADPAFPNLPEEAIVQILSFEGFKDIRDIELEGRTYEVKARTPDGARIELEVNAVTGEFAREDDESEGGRKGRKGFRSSAANDRALAPILARMGIGNPHADAPRAAKASVHPAVRRMAQADGWRDMYSRAPYPNMGVGNPHPMAAAPDPSSPYSPQAGKNGVF